jgi:hypothetical protein
LSRPRLYCTVDILLVFPSSSSGTSSAVSHRFSALLESPAFRISVFWAHLFSRIAAICPVPISNRRNLPTYLLESPNRVFGGSSCRLILLSPFKSPLILRPPSSAESSASSRCRSHARLWLGNYERSWIKRTGRKGSQTSSWQGPCVADPPSPGPWPI